MCNDCWNRWLEGIYVYASGWVSYVLYWLLCLVCEYRQCNVWCSLKKVWEFVWERCCEYDMWCCIICFKYGTLVIAQLVERWTVVICMASIHRSLVRFRFARYVIACVRVNYIVIELCIFLKSLNIVSYVRRKILNK